LILYPIKTLPCGFVLLLGTGGYVLGNNVALCISCDTDEQTTSVHNYFAEGGQILEPLQKQFWGAYFGMVADRFGIR